jgi:SAM-dependent methyltransferase
MREPTWYYLLKILKSIVSYYILNKFRFYCLTIVIFAGVFMRPDKGKPYYTAYDKRYRAVYEQGADHWLFLPDYETIKTTVYDFVSRFGLKGRNVVDLGCGEGLSGFEFAKLGCIYQGFDIAPAAIDKARVLLSFFQNAQVTVLDVVKEELPRATFDAGIDVACLHMLVTDADRHKYLTNVFNCLIAGAPMIFAHQRLENTEYDGHVKNYRQWLKISGDNVDTPQERTAIKDGQVIPVRIPLIASRPRSEEGYRNELENHGFDILQLTKTKNTVNILVIKPNK